MLPRHGACHTLAVMALTEQQRAELEQLGLAMVQMKVANSGAGLGATVQHMASGVMTRKDVEDWVAQRTSEQVEQQTEMLRLARASSQQQSATLRWARIAGWAAIAAVVLAVLVPIAQALISR